jgi:Tn3 transposase DDE domain-containing protein
MFSYASELGTSQTARHTNGLITRQVLRRLNDQHITAPKLEASLRDVIAAYMRFELPLLWGSGQAAIADGTHIPLRGNNLLGAHHVRYGSFGGVAYHHISDTYIALFRLFVVFGESQSAVLDLADGITRRPCAELHFPDSFPSKAVNFYPATHLYGYVREWCTSLSNHVTNSDDDPGNFGEGGGWHSTTSG